MTDALCSTLSIVLTGSGGAGVMTAGQTLLDAATSCGLYGLMTRSTGPQIRGGEAAAMLRLGARPVLSHGDRFDVLVALDFENIQRFAAELPLDGDSIILADPQAGETPEFLVATGARIAHVALGQTRQVHTGRPRLHGRARRAGAADRAAGKRHRRGGRGIDRAEKTGGDGRQRTRGFNGLGRRAGHRSRRKNRSFPRRSPPHRWSLTGNEATGFGAIKGGVKFVAGYPITPATEILEWMAPALQQCGGVLVQAEDELASINMLIGASFGGVASLTATAGPGLSLMIESLGLAVASETPLVVVDVMRSGPSTGIATKSEQSDLNIAVYGLHGDAPHVVVAPLDVADCLPTTQWAVHLAETLADAGDHALRPIDRPGARGHRPSSRRDIPRPKACVAGRRKPLCPLRPDRVGRLRRWPFRASKAASTRRTD